LAALVLFALMAVSNPQATFAQGGVDDPAGPFQLESNATTDTNICFNLSAAGAQVATPGNGNSCPSGFSLVTFSASSDDWQSALGFSGTSHALATSFVGPNTNPSETFNSKTDAVFFGGGSKDTLGISSGPWEWNSTTAPDKDDIEHAYAAAYNLPNNHIAIYFGMDRYSNSGDATAGFWFFQDSSIALSNTKQGGGLLFSGHHSDGDLLIVSDFSQGGAIGSIQAFKWSCGSAKGAACDSGGSLVAASSLLTTNITCDPRTGKSSFCGIVNDTDGLTAPWGFSGKEGNTTTMSHGDFLEGGIDLNTIFGSNIPCFSTFMAETRSSNSPTSSLQDVTPPISFPLCGMSVTKVCNGAGQVSADGTSVSYSYSATVSNDGIGPLYNVSLHDTLPDGTVQDIPVTLPDTCNGSPCLGSKHTATVSNIPFTATSTNCHSGVTNCTTPLDAINTTTAKGFTAPSGGTEIDSKSPAATAECKASPSSSVTVEKHCDADAGGATLFDAGSVVEVKVFYTAKVCNTGQSQLTSINLADDWGSPLQHDSLSSISSLAPGACTTVKGNYVPNSIDSTSGRYGFTDTVRVTGATATLGANPTPATGCPIGTDLACSSITCPICFNGYCSLTTVP